MSITSNMRIPAEYIGLTGLLCPGIAVCSSSRQELFAKNIGQPRVPDAGGDFPDMFAGFETIFGDYCFNSARRENKIKVIKVIDKYPSSIANIKPGNNPLKTVIFRDLVTGEIGYFDVRKYSSYSNDFGYRNVMKTNIQVDDVIPPDVEIYSSPIKKGDEYCLGVNANVCFATFLETTEDCFMISESLAKKVAPLSIEDRSISSSMRKYPLNLYGTDDQFKIVPDLGEFVRDDGVLCAFRPVRRFSSMSDLQPHKLKEINHIFDKKIYAHPGAQVVDIEVYIDNKNDLPQNVYDQVKVYYEARISYWKQVVEVYEKVKHLPISFKFNTLVTKAMGRLLAAKQPVPSMGKRQKVTLVENFNPVVFRIDITLMHKVVINNGHKFAGRDGAKGVVRVKPDNEMPIDQQGFRADICIDPVSVLKRTNIIQLYEQYINRLLKWQAMNLHKLGSIENQFNRIVEVLNDINPEYAKVIIQSCNNPDKIIRYVEDCKSDTIKICIPPGMDNLTKDMILKLDEKYQTPISPVDFVIDTPEGKKTIRTKEPICIGAKYVYLLAKYPKPLAPGFGFVNKCHMPVGSSDKHSTPIGTKPIRFGESESRIFAATVDIKSVLRWKCLYSGSRLGPKCTISALMNTDKPSQLTRIPISTEELYNDCPSIRIAHHMFETCGVDLQNSLISVGDGESIFEQFKDLL